jgi:kynurenine formamidase
LSEELRPALYQLLESQAAKGTLNKIAGFASLNYGLSTFEPDSEEGRRDKALSVKHPTHILDIFKALEWLQKHYSVGEIAGGETEKKNAGYNWIAVGHSCGATLSFQACMADAETWSSHSSSSTSSLSSPSPSRIKPPIAVVGLEGIYSLPLLSKNYASEPFYDFFITSAFGPDKDTWRDVSPVSGQYQSAYLADGLDIVVLGHSSEDELVDWEQVGLMRMILGKQGWEISDDEGVGHGRERTEDKIVTVKRRRELVILKLKGRHDAVWKEGTGVRTCIEVAVKKIFWNGRLLL